MTTGYVGDGETLPTTPEEALDLLSGYVDVSSAPNPGRKDIGAAFEILGGFIKQVREHDSDDLEWGEPGDCWERIYNDTDIHEELGLGDQYGDADFPNNGETWESVQARAIALGLGFHYGDPHCIWCLEAS